MTGSKKRKTLGGDTPFIWDNSTVLSSDCRIEIHGTEEEFRAVASYLYGNAAIRWPDENLTNDTRRPITAFDLTLRNAIHAIAFQLSSAMVICGDDPESDDMKLRQKPSDPCILQQIQDGEWIDVFDYSLCLSGVITAISDNTYDIIAAAQPAAEALMREFDEKYTGTSQSFDSKLNMDEPDADNARRRLALCEALTITAKNYAAASLKLKEQEGDTYERGSLAIGIGVAIVGLLATIATAGAFGPALAAWIASYTTLGSVAIAGATLGVSTTALSVWATYVKDQAKEIYEDQNAIREYACIWFESFTGITDISFEQYQAGVDVSGANLENTGYMETTFAPLRTQPLAYVAFLKEWKRAIEYSENGFDPDCSVCDDPDVIITRWPVGGGGDWTNEAIDYVGKNGANDVYILGSTFNNFQWSHGSFGSIPYVIMAIEAFAGAVDGELIYTNEGAFDFTDVVGKTTTSLAFYSNAASADALIRIEVTAAP